MNMLDIKLKIIYLTMKVVTVFSIITNRMFHKHNQYKKRIYGKSKVT